MPCTHADTVELHPGSPGGRCPCGMAMWGGPGRWKPLGESTPGLCHPRIVDPFAGTGLAPREPFRVEVMGIPAPIATERGACCPICQGGKTMSGWCHGRWVGFAGPPLLTGTGWRDRRPASLEN